MDWAITAGDELPVVWMRELNLEMKLTASARVLPTTSPPIETEASLV